MAHSDGSRMSHERRMIVLNLFRLWFVSFFGGKNEATLPARVSRQKFIFWSTVDDDGTIK